MRIGVGLSIPELATRGGRFSPASLFTSGVNGAWYDPSDTSTLFQDSAGTTPVTAVEQPVGLMLDKSQGLVLGSELVTNGDFASASGWTLPGTGTNSITGGQAVLSGAAGYLLRTGTSITASQWYRVSFTVSGYSGSGTVRPYIQASPVFGSNVTGNGTFVQYLLATATNANTEVGLNFATSFTGNIDDISIKSLAGNHALQATSASRPVLRARYNLLTYSEQFDNAAWSKTNVTLTANAIAAPDGTLTADNAAIFAATAVTYVQSNAGVAVSVGTFTVSCYVKANGVQYANVGFIYSAGIFSGTQFDLTNGTVVRSASASYTSPSATITPLSNGWYRCTHTVTVTTTVIYPMVSPSNALWTAGDPRQSLTGNGTDGIYIWGAQLAYGSVPGNYQRIAAATDYATAGFLPYLALDGTDDSFGTNSIDFSATDEMSVCVGVAKLSDAALAFISELSANVNTNNGSFYLLAPSSAGGNDFTFSSKGTTSTPFISVTSASPVTNVFTAQSKISTPVASIRKNGSASGSSSATQGTGNFGNYPLYIGRRNNTSSPFNGRIYQMVICGKTLSASELASTEAYVNSKTGAY